MERLGIIGGLGPAATARLFAQIVAYTDAACDQEHLDVTILNRPRIPDRTAYLLGKPGARSFVEPMQEAARELEAAGCSVLATPCNTAHARLDAIASQLVSARFVDMPASAAEFARELGCSRVGVLATDGALATGVYQRALDAAGVESVLPDEAVQAKVMSIIYDDVKAGRAADGRKVDAVCAALADAGCDGIMLGCTELSLLGLPRRRAAVRIVDALDVLAWKCIAECGAKARDLNEEYRRPEANGNGSDGRDAVGANTIE